MISSKLRDVSVTLVGLSISCVTFTVAQKERDASPVGFLRGDRSLSRQLPR